MGKIRLWGLGRSGGLFSLYILRKRGPKAPYNYPASFWTNIFLISFWKNRKVIMFMIFGFWDVPMTPNTNYFNFGDTKTLYKIPKNINIHV